MPNLLDLTGTTIGRWSIIERDINSLKKDIRWLCRCSCGTTKSVAGRGLRSGRSTSCGCFNLERRKTACLKHGGVTNGKPTPTYSTWQAMRSRCRATKNVSFKNYGGRGIFITPRWDDYAAFLEDMGPRPKGLTLDRINNEDGYYKNNCRWATNAEQASNRRNCHYVSFMGKKMTITQAAFLNNIRVTTVNRRLKRGWSLERALT